ncbi:hypothetical protein [Amycolatopsis sp. NPDC051903]|uniref:hypothetical protein n=1 Tax=Amycolatopsis sp. NPDC051903 TaxID=3363936 RepID=UPI0037B117CB
MTGWAFLLAHPVTGFAQLVLSPIKCAVELAQLVTDDAQSMVWFRWSAVDSAQQVLRFERLAVWGSTAAHPLGTRGDDRDRTVDGRDRPIGAQIRTGSDLI